MADSGVKIFPISELKLLDRMCFAICTEQIYCYRFCGIVFFGEKN